jgi:hypothetical protein
LAVSTINGTTANVVWAFSNGANEATNKYFALSLYPSSTSASMSSFKIPVYANQRSYYFTNLSTMYYTFLVQSINDAGYSLPNVSTLQLVASIFYPTLISGLQAWLDGNDPNGNGTPGSNGGGLSTWYDKSGLSRNMSLSGSGITYSNGSQNGKNTISLNGTMAINLSIPIGTFPSNYCGFIVLKTTSGGGEYFARTDNSGWPQPLEIYGNDTRFCGTAPNQRTTIGTGLNIGTACTSMSLFNFALTTYGATGGTGTYSEYFNGTQVSVTGGQTTGLNAADLVSNIYFAGRSGSSVAYNAIFCEILVYNSNMSATDRQKVEGYLAWKWGIQGRLPGAHPYSGGPPTGN